MPAEVHTPGSHSRWEMGRHAARVVGLITLIVANPNASASAEQLRPIARVVQDAGTGEASPSAPEAETTRALGGDEKAAPPLSRQALSLFASGPRDVNSVYAPVDLASAFAPLAAVARGRAGDELRQLFGGWGEDALLSVHPLASQSTNRSAPGCIGTRAAALFAPQGLRPSPRFRELLSAAGVSFLASADPPGDLHAWFKDQGGSPPPLEGVRSGPLLIGTSSSFRGAEVSHAWRWWTDEGAFRLLDGRSKRVTMLEERREANYGQFGTVRIVELPYGCEGLSLLLILPETGKPVPRWNGFTGLGLGGIGTKKEVERIERENEFKTPGEALRAAEADLSKLDDWILELRPVIVKVSLPRFTVQASSNLEEPLRRIGLNRALSASADFSAAVDGEVRGIGAVAHQVVFTLDERSIRSNPDPIDALGPRGPRHDYALHFRVDRPFLFVVRDTRNGAIHTIGRVVDP